ncbi:MAG: substrate-binding domain-containing protein [Hungatella sp.]|nr:substrate-binding domain-containing protein [Hungatella sp.]
MAVTIQQIAELAGVSRGTVDRALNHRGRIAPEVAERVWKIADELGYTVKGRKKEKKKVLVKIGVVTQLARASFMLEINRGIKKAKEELAERGVEVLVKEVLSVDAGEQLKAIDELVECGINGLAMMPVESEDIRMRINELAENEKIPVVTFNSDIVGIKRSCFVGMDNKKSGRAAAGLLGMLTKGKGKILIITGSFGNPVNNFRVEGFVEELKNTYPELEIAGVQGSFDETEEVQRIIENTMMAVSGISGILVVSGGQAGVARAFETLKLDRRPYVVIYDQTPKNEKALREDSVDFLIDQNGYVQGYQPPNILADLILKGKQPKNEYWYTEIKIMTKYVLP